VSFNTRMEDPVRHANHLFISRVSARHWRWLTDKECEEMEEVVYSSILILPIY